MDTFWLHIRDHNRELIAADACNKIVVAHVFDKSLGDQGENLIADHMTHGVIEQLESIEVDNQQAWHRLAQQRKLINSVTQRRAVGHAGE